ncbi:protein huluwa [Osmerus mordax]|uniref:protein huluwa n=1 Tax=Osmerus mordax TaxID=8014 RepID=UPI00350F4DDB
MSQINPSPNSNLAEGLPITSLTLLVLLLIPCVVLLLLLNCLFLGYKFLILSRRKRKREDSDSTLLQSTHSTHQRITRISEKPLLPNQDGKRTYLSMSEPMLVPPVTSSRTSSRGKVALDPRGIHLLRPNGTTGGGSGSLRSPSTILATSSTTPNSRPDLHRKSCMYSKSKWCWSAPVLPLSSDSETERTHRAPPNTPCVELGHMRRSSTMELQNVAIDSPEHFFDKVMFECEYASIPPEASCIAASVNCSTVGPGLDSDFGASAGVSLRILSADSDGLCNGASASALEWDYYYYDPCYVRQNNIPKHKHHRPAMHSRQYWV